ncbi:MAG: PAS domain-containing protein [Bdellovibrionia bacterium]
MQTKIANLTAELEFLRSTMDELGAGVTKLSLDGKVLWANPAYCKLLGYSPEEIIGLSIQETSLPEDLPLQLKAIEELTLGRRDSFSMDKRYRRKDGTFFWAHFVTKLQRDKDGQPTNFLTMVQDIHARKEAEIQLQKSERQLAESQRIAHLGSWERDVATETYVWSDETYRIFGFEPGQIKPTVALVAGMIHSDDRDARSRLVKASYSKPGSYSNTCRIIRHSDGAVRVIRAHANYECTPEGTPLRIYGTTQDITGLMENESARERSESLLNLVLDAVPGLVSYIDQDLCYRFANQTYKKWFDMEPQSLAGKHMAQVLGPEAFEMVLPRFQRVLNGETVEWEGQLPFQYGGTRDVRSIYIPDWNPDGDVHGIIVLTMDVTSVKEGEKLIAQQRERLTQSARLAALGEMASGIAHEINNPLSIIFARAEILKDTANRGTLDPEKVAKWAEKFLDTAIKISKIVKSIRAISRNGDGDPFEPTSIRSIFDDMAELCAGRFIKEQIRFQIELKVQDLVLESRQVQLGQVILNLLNNACDAAMQSQDRWIRLEAKDLGDTIEISVADSGPGISPELEQKIFLAFFTTKPVGQGTGLGLSLSQNIVRAHRGSLKLDRSTPHTRFLITLPKRQSQYAEGISSLA